MLTFAGAGLRVPAGSGTGGGTFAMTETELQQADSILGQFNDQRANLIPILQDIQGKYYYLPQEVLTRVARKLRIPLTDVYQVATFYRCFSLAPRGRHQVQVCLGTACHVRGAPRVLDRILTDLKLGAPGTTRDRQFTVLTVRCVGCCGLAPVVRVDDKTHPHLTQAKVRGMLNRYRLKQQAQEEVAATEEAGDRDATAQVS
jgi:NADH:ubiquinone oxidoreductase subunit E